jgi:hypothetical protein
MTSQQGTDIAVELLRGWFYFKYVLNKFKNAGIVVAFTTFTGYKYNFAWCSWMFSKYRGNKYTQTHKQFNNIKLQTFEITQQCQFY